MAVAAVAVPVAAALAAALVAVVGALVAMAMVATVAASFQSFHELLVSTNPRFTTINSTKKRFLAAFEWPEKTIVSLAKGT